MHSARSGTWVGMTALGHKILLNDVASKYNRSLKASSNPPIQVTAFILLVDLASYLFPKEEVLSPHQ